MRRDNREQTEAKNRSLEEELSDGFEPERVNPYEYLNETEPNVKNSTPIDHEGAEKVDESKFNKDDNLMIMGEVKREPRLEVDDYPSTVGRGINAKREPIGMYGPWVKITIPFNVKDPKNDEIVTVNFIANKSIDPKSRLYSILKGILGRTPEAGLNLRELEGKRVMVSIEHRVDENGNVWENVSSVRPLWK